MSDRDAERERAHDETGKCAFESIKEMVENLSDWQKAGEAAGWSGPYKDEFGVTYFEDLDTSEKWACKDWQTLCRDHAIEADERSEEGEQAIHEDPLSVMVRDGWRTPGGHTEEGPEEYEILLSTGGPATRIVGKLDRYSEPETARLEVQDWFVPWKEWRGTDPKDQGKVLVDEEILLTYARCFYFADC